MLKTSQRLLYLKNWRQCCLSVFYGSNWIIFLSCGLLLGFAVQLLLKVLLVQTFDRDNSILILSLSICAGFSMACTSIYAAIMTSQDHSTTFCFFTLFINIPIFLALSFLINFSSFWTDEKEYLKTFHEELFIQFYFLATIQQVLAGFLVLLIWIPPTTLPMRPC